MCTIALAFGIFWLLVTSIYVWVLFFYSKHAPRADEDNENWWDVR